MQQSCAPMSMQKQSEILCFTLGIRMARSPRLLVNENCMLRFGRGWKYNSSGRLDRDQIYPKVELSALIGVKPVEDVRLSTYWKRVGADIFQPIDRVSATN